jgi:hypothetical protein
VLINKSLCPLQSFYKKTQRGWIFFLKNLKSSHEQLAEKKNINLWRDFGACLSPSPHLFFTPCIWLSFPPQSVWYRFQFSNADTLHDYQLNIWTESQASMFGLRLVVTPNYFWGQNLNLSWICVEIKCLLIVVVDALENSTFDEVILNRLNFRSQPGIFSSTHNGLFVSSDNM